MISVFGANHPRNPLLCNDGQTIVPVSGKVFCLGGQSPVTPFLHSNIELHANPANMETPTRGVCSAGDTAWRPTPNDQCDHHRQETRPTARGRKEQRLWLIEELSYVQICVVSLACMGVAQAWGCVNAPQINCLVTPGLNNAGGGTSAHAVWKKADADEGLRQAFERATYSLEDSGHGTYRGVNPGQRLILEFNDREARLRHPGGNVNFHLTGYGYGDRLQKPTRAMLTATGNRVDYQGGDLTEWYLNGGQGLEQGFTLVTGRLAPAKKANAGTVLYESGKGVVLRYAGLTALDAQARILPSRLEVRGREIRLILEDYGAQYPLVVDPTWTQQQELTACDDAANDYFGSSVSEAEAKSARFGLRKEDLLCCSK